MGFTTRQIHSGVQPDPVTGSILTPIYQTTTYVQPSVDEYLSQGLFLFPFGKPYGTGAGAQTRRPRGRC
jgi:O-acetylhomoserine/O-acetylserine sulfhydrylase-like pyridoxal-dependent enzyme